MGKSCSAQSKLQVVAEVFRFDGVDGLVGESKDRALMIDSHPQDEQHVTSHGMPGQEKDDDGIAGLLPRISMIF